jgi:hypothetical protein
VRNAVLERDVEIGALDSAPREVVAGRGGVVVLEAAAGLGKTTLLRHLRHAAREAGCTVLSVCGAELERDFTFGAVQQLFGPVPAADGDARLFAGAARAAECLFSPSAVCAEPPQSLVNGLHGPAVDLAGTAPVVVLVDDVRWLDLPSSRYWSSSRAGPGRGDGGPLEDILAASDVRPDAPLDPIVWCGSRSPDREVRPHGSAGPKAVVGAKPSGRGSFSSMNTECVGVSPTFSPECSCSSSHRTAPAGRSTPTSRPPAWIRRRKELSVTITLSGCRCGAVRSPGPSRYSSTRTRSFSKATRYSSGFVSVGSSAMTAS